MTRRHFAIAFPLIHKGNLAQADKFSRGPALLASPTPAYPDRMSLLIVDGANVVGSRPDGWWRDRPGAARRLWEGLAAVDLADEVVLVLEGAARKGVPAGRSGSVDTLHAPGSGDDAIVDAARTKVARDGTSPWSRPTASCAAASRPSARGRSARPGCLTGSEAGSSEQGCLAHHQRPRVRVEHRGHPERERQVAGFVPDGQSPQQRYAERGRAGRPSGPAPTRATGSRVKSPRTMPAHAVEPAGTQQLGDHPVEPVDLLADLLEHRDRLGRRAASCGCRAPRRAARCCRRRAPPRRVRGPGAIAGSRRERRARVTGLEAAAPAGARATRRPRLPATVTTGPCTVDRPSRAANAWCSAVTSENPTSDLGPRGGERLPVEQVDHPLHAVPSARAEHRLHVGVAPGPHRGRRRGRRRRRRGTPKRSSRAARVLPHPYVETPRPQHVETGVEPLGDHRTGRGHDRDPVAGTQPRRRGSASGPASSGRAPRPCGGAGRRR